MRKILAILALLALTHCAAEPADGPGLCKLRCSDAIIASNDYNIEVLTSEITLRCPLQALREDVFFDVFMKFAVTKKRLSTGGEEKVTVPNVSVRPVVNGSVDLTQGDDTYIGVSTPDSNFCSDQCGVVSLTVRGLCPQVDTSEISAYLLSGSLVSEPGRATFEAPTEDDDNNGGATNGTGNDNTNNTNNALVPLGGATRVKVYAPDTEPEYGGGDVEFFDEGNIDFFIDD